MSGAVQLQTLGKNQAAWIVRFTGGEVNPSKSAVAPDDELDDDALEDDALERAKRKLQMLQDKDAIREMAMKEKLINDALTTIADMEKELQDAAGLQFQRAGSKEWEQLRPEDGDQAADNALELGRSLAGIDKVRNAAGEEFDARDARFAKANTALFKLQEMVNKDLAMASWERWRIPADAQPPYEPVKVKEKLFTPAEIAEEIYTPMVRDKLIGETTVPAKFSKTQTMLDGSDDYYIKECKEKGKPADSGGAALAKSGIALGISIGGTIVSGLTAPSASSGQQGNVLDPLSKGDANRITTIMTGVGAILTGLVDVADKADSWRKGGEITADDVISCLTSMGKGIEAVIVGKSLDPNASDDSTQEKLGSIQALTDLAGTCAQVAPAWVKWFKGGRIGSPPWDFTISSIGTVLGDVMTYQGDTISDTGADNAYAAAGSVIGAAFPIFANAIKNQVFQKLVAGDKKAAFDLLTEAGLRAGRAFLEIDYTNNVSNTATSDAAYSSISNSQTDMANATEANVGTAQKLSALVASKSGMFQNLDKATRAKLLKDQAKKFQEEKAKQDEAKITAADIEKQLAAEQKDYRESLVRLGREKPQKEEDYKSIANLIAQIEADRAIFDGITGMFGSAIGTANAAVEVFSAVAGEVVPPLKAAGQVVKFCTNIRAAMDRIEALEHWREAQKDAVSAVSPYATSIQRFVSSQETQRNQYCIQAGANAINVVLTAAQMSPLAPAFKAASGAVTAAASLADMIYKFRKAQALAAAWKQTKQAIDPANRNDRKMRLVARKMNPTLAKYTIAYGAVVEEDPIAITALDRIGLDRETLVNSAGAVKDVKKYLETLYPDDGSVYVTLDAAGPAGFKAPPPELTPKTWALTFAAFKDSGIVSKNPPQLVGYLALFSELGGKIVKQDALIAADATDDRKLVAAKRALQQQQLDAAIALDGLFRSFSPQAEMDDPAKKAKAAALVYADLAGAEVIRLKAEMEPEEEGEPVGKAGLRRAGQHSLPK